MSCMEKEKRKKDWQYFFLLPVSRLNTLLSFSQEMTKSYFHESSLSQRDAFGRPPLVHLPGCCPYVEQAVQHEMRGAFPSHTSSSDIKDNGLCQPVKGWSGKPLRHVPHQPVFP